MNASFRPGLALIVAGCCCCCRVSSSSSSSSSSSAFSTATTISARKSSSTTFFPELPKNPLFRNTLFAPSCPPLRLHAKENEVALPSESSSLMDGRAAAQAMMNLTTEEAVVVVEENVVARQFLAALKIIPWIRTTAEEGEGEAVTTVHPAALLEGEKKDELAGTEITLTAEGLAWRGVVVVLCALWASNFAVAKVVLAQPGVDSGLFAVARFGIAVLALLPGAVVSVRRGDLDWDTARGALACGSWVAFGYLGQLIGLLDTTASRSCVICSLNCIFVAIVAEFARMKLVSDAGEVDGVQAVIGEGGSSSSSEFDLRKLIPAMIAVLGVGIIELKGAAGGPTTGDLISFTQPIGFGMGYILLEDLMKKKPSAALPVSAIKLAVVSAAALAYFEVGPHAATLSGDAVGWGFHPALPDFGPILASPTAVGAILYMGLVTTALSLWVESVAFQRVPAADASLILTTEPLFAAAVSATLIGETFGASDLVGAAFIVGACAYAVKTGGSAEGPAEEEEKEEGLVN